MISPAVAQQPACAEDASCYTCRPAGLQIGGGVLVKKRPYKGIDTRVIGIPFIMYECEKWSIKGTQLDYNLTNDGPCSVKALLRLRTEGYDADDSSFLDGMDDRDITLDAGLGFTYKHRLATFRFDALTDTLGKNKGQELSLSVSKPMPNAFGLKKTFMSPFAGVEWRTTSLNDYYYGVKTKEATPARSAYKSSSDANVFIGLACNHKLGENSSIFAMIKNTWLGDEITESSIVDKDYELSLVAGLTWNF